MIKDNIAGQFVFDNMGHIHRLVHSVLFDSKTASRCKELVISYLQFDSLAPSRFSPGVIFPRRRKLKARKNRQYVQKMHTLITKMETIKKK